METLTCKRQRRAWYRRNSVELVGIYRFVIIYESLIFLFHSENKNCKYYSSENRVALLIAKIRIGVLHSPSHDSFTVLGPERVCILKIKITSIIIPRIGAPCFTVRCSVQSRAGHSNVARYQCTLSTQACYDTVF